MSAACCAVLHGPSSQEEELAKLVLFGVEDTMCCKHCKATWSAAHWSSAADKVALNRRMLWQGPLCCHRCNHLIQNVQVHASDTKHIGCDHPLPELLTRDRLPEAAMEHAMRAVATDCQVKRWKPHPCSKWELLYSYAQRQIDCNSLEGKARQPSSPPNLLGPCIR